MAVGTTMKTHEFELELVLCGVAVEEKHKGDSLTVSKCEFTYSGSKLSNCIYIKYNFDFQSDQENLNQDFINNFLITEVSLLLNLISLLLARPTQSVAEKTKIDGNEVKIRLPARKIPRGIYNLAAGLRFRPTQEIKRYVAKIHKDCWDILETLLNKSKDRPELVRDLSMGLRWFTKGSDEFSSIDRLMAFWIAFNSLYADETKKEQEAIRDYLRANVKKLIAERLVSRGEKLLKRLSSINVELRQKGRKVKVNADLARLLQANELDHVAILETAILTIYGVRNKLFHGEYDSNSDETQETTSLSEAFLSDVIKELISCQINAEPLPRTHFVFEEKVGLG